MQKQLYAFIISVEFGFIIAHERPFVNAIVKNEEVAYEDVTDDAELVAVIAAAIAAYEGSGSASGYVVRSLKRRV